MENPLRNIPSVNELISSPPLAKLVDRVSHNVVVGGVRTFLENVRGEIEMAATDFRETTTNDWAEKIARWIVNDETPPLRPVINATGILLHTGLGRAPLADEAIEEIAAMARGYASLEVNLASGQRSQRIDAVERLLCDVTGAEAAVVVNNNAAATLLALAALAKDREVIVSRGELIEIGGSFRLPEVMEVSGARLREVGTTNKTRISDYAQAIGENTGALLRVHSSNYRIVGFTEAASIEALVALGRDENLPVIDDIGSGALVDFDQFNLPSEPVARDSIEAGADVVLFSGDKLLGGPQCGIIVGRKKSIELIARHPMMRALRVDKITLAALAATLRIYRDEKQALLKIPLLSLLNTSMDNLRNRAERIASQIGATSIVESAEPMEESTYLGGGSVPAQSIPTWCIAIVPANGSLEKLATRLRCGVPSIFGRIHDEKLLLDLRSLFPRDDVHLVEAFEALSEDGETSSDEEI